MKNRIKYLRKSEGYDLTQEELARQIGITRAALSDIENGKVKPTGMVMLNLAKFFDVDIREIFLD